MSRTPDYWDVRVNTTSPSYNKRPGHTVPAVQKITLVFSLHSLRNPTGGEAMEGGLGGAICRPVRNHCNGAGWGGGLLRVALR